MRRPVRWLAPILVLSFALNAWGANWGLPERWHPDELTQRAENMVGEPSLNPHYFAYGGLHYYVIAALAVLPVKIPNKLFHLMDYDMQTTLVVLASRLLSAVLGMGLVGLTYRIGERLFDARTGLFAAALLATSMVLVNLSHFATADVPSLFWFTLACVFATDILLSGRPRSYLLAGLCSGLAAAVKYVGGLSMVPLVAAHLLAGSPRHRLLGAALCMSAVGFGVGNPVLLFAPLEFIQGFAAESAFNSARGLGLPRSFLPLVSQLKDAMGLPVLLLSFAGLVYALRLLASDQHRASVVLVLSMVVPYYLVAGAMRGPRAGPLLLPQPPLRYALPIVPFLLLFAGKMLSDLIVARHRVIRRVGLALFAVASCYSTVYAGLVDLKFTHDSRYAAREWILGNVMPGSTIEITSYGPTVSREEYRVIERPHDNQVAEVAASLMDSERHRPFWSMVHDLEAWLDRVGLRSQSGDYVPWYRRALQRYEADTVTFDASIQGLESRAPDVLVVSDLYSVRFWERSSIEATFFADLSAGRTSYSRVGEFHYHVPRWINPPAEFVNPTIAIYSRSHKASRLIEPARRATL